MRIGKRGLNLNTNENLTCVRYADYVCLYAVSWQDLVFMLEALGELHRIGLRITSKTGILTTQSLTSPTYDIADGMVESFIFEGN